MSASSMPLTDTWIMAAIFCVVMAGTTLPAPLYPLFQRAIGLTGADVSMVFAVYAVAVLVSLILAGGWSDQLGRKPLLFAALVAALLGDLVFFWSDRMSLLLVARALSGLSAGIFTASATIAVIELAPADWKGPAGILASGANMGGLGLGPLMAGLVSECFPWPTQLVFVLHAVLVVGAILALTTCPETRLRVQRISLRPRPLRLSEGTRGAFPTLGVASFTAFALIGLMTSLEPTILRGELGITHPAVTGASIFFVFGASLAGQLLQARLVRSERFRLSCAVLLAGSLILGFALFIHSLVALLIGALVVGLGQGGVFAASVAEVADTSAPGDRVETMAVLFVVAYLGVAVPVLGLGFAIDCVGMLAAGLGFCVVMAGLATLALLLYQIRPVGVDGTATKRRRPVV